MSNFIADRRLCLTRDGRLVEETNSAAEWLFCVPGQEIPLAEARKYGLISDAPAVKESAPSEDKAIWPAETKRSPGVRKRGG